MVNIQAGLGRYFIAFMDMNLQTGAFLPECRYGDYEKVGRFYSVP